MTQKTNILGSKILVVDDNPANVKILNMMLAQAGYANVLATTEPTKVSALHREHGFDLIVLDIEMPDMNGFEVMDALGRTGAPPHPAVLVVTAQPGHKLRAMQAGANDFMSKPFDHAEVLTRVHYLLEVRQLRMKAESYSVQLEETVQIRTEELRRSEVMFRELVANIPDALWIRDVKRGTIAYVNPAWSNLNGGDVVAGDPIAKGLRAIHPDDLEWLTNERRAVLGDQSRFEYRLLGPDQSIRWVHTHTFPIANPDGPVPLTVEIIEDITQRKEAQLKLVHLTRHDVLTGIPNRALVYESLKLAIEQAGESGLAASVLLVDVDHFKKVNDTIGHTGGDGLLREFAARLSKCLRPGDTVGRLGGDEFAIVILTPNRGQGPMEVANRIQEALRQPFDLDGRSVPVTASIGLASYPYDAQDQDSLICCADVAMYDAKACGRNAVRCYTAQMSARANAKLDVHGALRFAQTRNEFVLHFQPKMHIASGDWSGVEALLRWNRPDHGTIPPGLFVPALEEMGLIIPVGNWVIETACRHIRDWERRGVKRARIAVNVSSRQIREQGFASRVADIVKKHSVDPALLEFEITESTLMAEGDATDQTLRQLKDLGIAISIDDFGTGYSNLAYLKRFPIDKLKIDIAFIRDVTINPDDAAIAIAIIKMAHSLRLKVIAEGVETAEQLTFLRTHGCDEAQGYHLAKPLPAAKIIGMLRRNSSKRISQKQLSMRATAA